MKAKQFFKLLNWFDVDKGFIRELKSVPYENLEILGLTKIDPFKFTKRYFNSKLSEVTIDPNANVDRKAPSNYFHELAKSASKLVGLEDLYRKGCQLYDDFSLLPILDGSLYFHDATHIFKPYCLGASCLDLVLHGMPFKRPASFPPKG